MKKILNRYAGQVKRYIKDLTYRMDDTAQGIVFWSEGLPKILQSAVKCITFTIHDFVRFLRDFPRVKAFRLTGNEWSVVFVGGDDEYRVIEDLIFQDQEVQVELLSKVLVWKLPAQTTFWLESGVDLVICELSRLFPWKPTAQYSFTGPDLVVQVLQLPENLEDLLIGRRIEGNRRWIRKAEKQGLSYRFTRSLKDLEFFHREMYVPFIGGRHGETAHLSSLEDHERWLKYGGLILVSLNEELIGGAIVTRSGEMCHFIEYGILHGDSELLKKGAVSLVVWSCLQWAKEQGAERFDLGGSQPWCSHGILQYKSKWGARVEQFRLGSRPKRTYLSNRLPESLRERINEIGWVSEAGGKHYCVNIPAGNEELDDDRVQEALRRGLDGSVIIRPGSVHLITG